MFERVIALLITGVAIGSIFAAVHQVVEFAAASLPPVYAINEALEVVENGSVKDIYFDFPG